MDDIVRSIHLSRTYHGVLYSACAYLILKTIKYREGSMVYDFCSWTGEDVGTAQVQCVADTVEALFTVIDPSQPTVSLKSKKESSFPDFVPCAILRAGGFVPDAENQKKILYGIEPSIYAIVVWTDMNAYLSWDFPCSPKRFLSRVRTTARHGPGTTFSFVTREDIPHVLNFRSFLMEELMAVPTEEHIMRDGDAVEVVSQIDQANARAGDILYGKLPPIKADIYADMVRKLVDASPELKSMERFCAAAVDVLINYKREHGVQYF
ncbi:hypothetical protein POM88_000271 [Heracleum sosnowskyi]|uniref:Uncharacterized protein n=1 Tax=Heracleum sosnowskyi TaxID=360622 RepID=A0AAD8N9L6_9APIA|nr:hypothetical protein POM88_000271 [Heracleum sosnowskyi]